MWFSLLVNCVKCHSFLCLYCIGVVEHSCSLRMLTGACKWRRCLKFAAVVVWMALWIQLSWPRILDCTASSSWLSVKAEDVLQLTCFSCDVSYLLYGSEMWKVMKEHSTYWNEYLCIDDNDQRSVNAGVVRLCCVDLWQILHRICLLRIITVQK